MTGFHLPLLNCYPVISGDPPIDYPDPDWAGTTTDTKFAADDNGSSWFFGRKMDLSDDGVICATGSYGADDGATNQCGAVYMHSWNGSSWDQDAKLLASDRAALDFLGYDVAISGDGNTVLGGAYGDDTGGAAYVFFNSGGWSEQQKLQAGDIESGDEFGKAVALSHDGNTAVICSPGEDIDGSNVNAGAAYVFTRSGSTWTQQQKLTAPSRTAAANFGNSCTISRDGSVIAIGEPNTSTGNVYVYRLTGGTWTYEDDFTGSGLISGDDFGHGVSLSDDGSSLVASANRADIAYIFTESGGVWSEYQSIVGSDTASGDFYGNSCWMSGDGNTVVVGSHLNDHSSFSNPGAAYVFKDVVGTWTQQVKLIATDPEADANFGFGSAMSNDGLVIVVGAYRDNEGGTDGGAAYSYIASEV